MLNSRYTKTKETAPNKHLVLDKLYKDTSKVMTKNTSAVMLLGENPETAVERILRFIVRGSGLIYGYEINEISFKRLKHYKQKILTAILSRFKRSAGTLLICNTDVMSAPNVHFQDLDFCSPFISNRKNFIEQEKKGFGVHLALSDPINIICYRLGLMKALMGQKVMLVTVSTRAGFGKAFTANAINTMLKCVGWQLISIDGATRSEGYGKGKRVSTTGYVRKDGKVYHAYEHAVKIKPHCPDGTRARGCSLKMYTYTDTTHMLTLMLKFK